MIHYCLHFSATTALLYPFYITFNTYGGRPRSDYYEDTIKVKGYLDDIIKVAKEMLMKKPERMARLLFYHVQCSTGIEKDYEGSYKGVAEVVQYVPSIIEEYSKIIKSERSIESPSPHCITNLNYTSTSYGKIDDMVGNLSSLDISRTQELIQYSLGDKIVYLVKGYNRPHCH